MYINGPEKVKNIAGHDSLTSVPLIGRILCKEVGLESQTKHKIDSSILSVPHFLAQKVLRSKS